MSHEERFWDASARDYDKSESRFEEIHRRSRENTRKHLTDNDAVLDYGCGTGTTACYLAPMVRSVHGIDISAAMIELASDKASHGGIENATFAKQEIFDEKLESESFDAILAFNVFHTVPDPDRVVARMHELLKPEGLVVSVTPCFRDRASFVGHLQILLVRTLCMVGAISIPIRTVGSSDLDTLLLRSGDFARVEAESIFLGVSSYFLVAQKTSNSCPPNVR